MTEEHRFMSTITSMTKHIESFEHRDIEHEINALIENATRSMSTVDDIHEMCRFQGRIQALEAVLLLPENIIESLEDQAEHDKLELEEE